MNPINEPRYRKGYQKNRQSARPSKITSLKVLIISSQVRVITLWGVAQTRGKFARRKSAASECGNQKEQ